MNRAQYTAVGSSPMVMNLGRAAAQILSPAFCRGSPDLSSGQAIWDV
jgi:hypothetical protein